MTNVNQPETTLPPPQLVETPAAFEQMVNRLLQEPSVAVDTESNSLYAYHERVCLIQFSIPGEDYLVDPLVLQGLRPLAPFFASEEIEKIFHGSDYDLIVLQRDYQFTCGKLFDTMWAARTLGWPQVGLGNILENYFGVHPDKKFQRYNWGRRPLNLEAVTYARTDTHYLLPLRDLQRNALKEQGRWEEAQEIFTYLREHVSQPSLLDPEVTFWRIKGIQELHDQEKTTLYQLHLWREEMAQRLNRPTMKVIGNRQLLTLAHVQPRTKRDLATAGLTKHQIEKFGDSIMHALRTKHHPLPTPQNDNKRPPDEVMDRYQALRAWRKEVAAFRGVDSDVILPNAALWTLAWHPPATLDDLLSVPSIGPWREKTYGPDLLALTSGK